MKVTKLDVRTNHHAPGTPLYQWSELFISQERAVQYIKENYPGAIDISKDIHARYPWCENTKLNQYFTVEIQRFDENGDWDYPITHTFEVHDKEIIE